MDWKPAVTIFIWRDPSKSSDSHHESQELENSTNLLCDALFKRLIYLCVPVSGCTRVHRSHLTVRFLDVLLDAWFATQALGSKLWPLWLLASILSCKTLPSSRMRLPALPRKLWDHSSDNKNTVLFVSPPLPFPCSLSTGCRKLIGIFYNIFIDYLRMLHHAPQFCSFPSPFISTLYPCSNSLPNFFKIKTKLNKKNQNKILFSLLSSPPL